MNVTSASSPDTDTEPLGRCLRLLGILQARSYVSASSLASTMGVTTRTVRRDVVRLRDLGYRIDSVPGQGGGYSMRSGPKTPMLVLEPDEAQAVALSLAQSADVGLSGLDEPALTALLKIRRTMTAQAAARAETIHESTAVVGGYANQPSFADVSALAEAVAARRTVVFTHQRGRRQQRGGAAPQELERRVDPYRVVTFARRWYLFGWCHLRQDWRTFRVDRISSVHVTTLSYVPREAPEASEFVRHAVLEAPYTVFARVVVDAPPADVSELLPRNAAEVHGWPEGEAVPQRSLIVTGGEGLNYLALHLALLNVPMTVLDPPELLDELHALGRGLLGIGGVEPPPPNGREGLTSPTGETG
ncbi:helix-turn-helix transcriptional regulator [Citricoccus sp. GCM10030269]|uniref:helix-turn-helix transcriptional regulator n=1 Tax=Citricoccus sp. GCM10030269 TaxID=3273388 RepID=UPI00361F28BB